MKWGSNVLWHSIMNTYQIGGHDREPNQYVLVHNRFLGKPDDVFLVDKARLPGVIDISISQEVDSPAHSFTIVCEDKEGLLSPDYYLGKLPYENAFRGHLKSPWIKQLRTNTKIEIHLGYGTHIVRMVTGLIDDVTINAEAQTITLTGRSMYKRMIDNTITPFPNTKYLLPVNSMKISDAINRAFTYAGVEFKGKPIVDDQTNETFLIEKPMGLRGETYDEIVRPLVNSTFHYFYERPDGVVEQREIPSFTQKVEPVFTVDDKMHISELEYKYDDTDIYGTVIVESNGIGNAYSSGFLQNEILNGEKREIVLEMDWANTPYKRKLAALSHLTMMLIKVRAISITLPANPLLELYDPIRIQEKISTASMNYHIRAIDYAFNSGGFIQTLQCSINGGFVKPPAPPPPVTHLPNLNVSVAKVEIGVWDNGAVDLDVLTIRLNGKVIESNLILKDTPDTFMLELKKGRNIVEFIGVSAGRSANLTASMYAKDENGNLLTPSELIIDMPRTNVNSLGFYQGVKPVRRWVVNRA